jgi:TRAP-type C4-dicarboxylate transport system permease small subunit
VSFVDLPGQLPSGEPPSGRPAPARRGWVGAACSLIRYWALLGGAIILVLVLITAASALSNLFFSAPFAGEYELAKHFVGIAIFTFLPYCQITGANVTVDLFAGDMGPRAKAAMSLVASLLAVLFALVLLRQMALGFGDYLRFPEETAALHLPLWTAFPPILLSLLLLLIAALITSRDGWRALRAVPRE